MVSVLNQVESVSAMAVVRKPDNPTHVDLFDALASGLPMQLRFVLEDGSLLEAPGYDRITIGRQLRENHATLDLTPFEGAKNGISRRHIEILPVDGQVTVQDLYSVNGTTLNGEPLIPGERYPLKHGDILQPGEMKFTVWYGGAKTQA